MAIELSDKNRYPSRYSPGGWVRADQYISELMCERRARHLDKDLPTKFWNLDEWKGYFMYQLKLAQKMITEYQTKAIIMALQDSRTFKTYSLKVKWFKTIVEEYNSSLKKQETNEPDLSPVQTGTSFKRKEFNKKKSILNRLDELDDS